MKGEISMKELVVKEQVRIRSYTEIDTKWSEWEDTSDDFETACQKVKDWLMYRQGLTYLLLQQLKK